MWVQWLAVAASRELSRTSSERHNSGAIQARCVLCPIGNRDDGLSVEAFAVLQLRQQRSGLSQGDGLNDRNRKLGGRREIAHRLQVYVRRLTPELAD